jgi:uncharacterized membrane protein
VSLRVRKKEITQSSTEKTQRDTEEKATYIHAQNHPACSIRTFSDYVGIFPDGVGRVSAYVGIFPNSVERVSDYVGILPNSVERVSA